MAITLDQCRRLIVAAIIIASSLWSMPRAFATCGDYLLHLPAPWATPALDQTSEPQESFATQMGLMQLSSSADAHFHNPLLAISGSLAHSQNLPPQPASPCAGGRCQSAPPPSPINHPSRAVYLKQNASLDRLSATTLSDDSAPWAIPYGGPFPVNPTHAVDVPPPECACSHN